MEGNGYGALLSIAGTSVNEDLRKFLTEMSELGRVRLDSFHEGAPVPEADGGRDCAHQTGYECARRDAESSRR